MKRLKEQVTAMRTNGVQQTAKELVTRAKAGDKNKQSKLNKVSSKCNQKPSAKKKTMAVDAKPAPSSQPTGSGPTGRSRREYSFKDDLVQSMFEMLCQAKKLRLPEPQNQE